MNSAASPNPSSHDESSTLLDLNGGNVDVIHIFISAGHDYWGKQGESRMQHGIQRVSQVECVAGKGLVGDRYFGYRNDFKGQITFFDEAVYLEITQKFKLAKLPASVFRRNVILRGADLKSLMGQRFKIQNVIFEGAQECKPCQWMDRAVAPGVQKFLNTSFYGGLRAKIIQSGILHAD